MFCSPQYTAPTTPVLKQLPGTGEFWGLTSTYAESATFYVQLWWQGNTNTAPTFSTPPTLTIPVGTNGLFSKNDIPVIMQGPIWFAVTAAAVPAATSITGGEVLTFFLG